MMRGEDDESRLRPLFQGQRAEDELRAPPFRRCAAAGPARRPALVRWPRLALTGATLAVLAVFLIMVHGRPREAEMDLAQWQAFASWTPATDTLLTMASVPGEADFTMTTDSLMETGAIPANSSTTGEKDQL